MDARAEREFTEFVNARAPAMLRVARALTGDRQRAEDLLQEALTKLAGRWRKVDDPEAYLRKIIYHDQVSWWRRASRLREDPVAQPDDRPVPDSAGMVGRRLDLHAALQRLGPRQRAVLVLRFLEDLPEAQVAELLECSVGTVRSQSHRALARLRQLAPDLAESPPPVNAIAKRS